MLVKGSDLALCVDPALVKDMPEDVDDDKEDDKLSDLYDRTEVSRRISSLLFGDVCNLRLGAVFCGDC